MARAGATAAFTAAALLLAGGAAGASFTASGSASHTVQSAVLADPADLTATLGACLKGQRIEVELTWTPSVSPSADGYEVRRSEDGGATFDVIGTATPVAASGFIDTTAKLERDYVYAVVTTSAEWRSPGAVTTAITTPTKAACR